MTTNRTPEPAAPQLQPDGTYLWGGKPLTPRTLTTIDVLKVALIRIAGTGIRVGQTGVRITISPVPMYTEDAHTKCVSLDITDAGLAEVINQLGVTPEQLAALTTPTQARGAA